MVNYPQRFTDGITVSHAESVGGRCPHDLAERFCVSLGDCICQWLPASVRIGICQPLLTACLSHLIRLVPADSLAIQDYFGVANNNKDDVAPRES